MREDSELRPVPRFSVVIVARDEALTIAALLDDLAAFMNRGGEVLLLDTGSADDTVAIAWARGCRVEVAGKRFETLLDDAGAAEIERRFAEEGEGPLVSAGQRLFHFGEARQRAGLLASNTFVLQLDASDRLAAFDFDVLDGSIATGEGEAFEYDLLTGNVRLRVARFYNRQKYRWVGRVHESLASIESTPAAIRCDSAQLLVQHHKQSKARHYLAGLALEVMEHPESSRAWHYLGRELYYHGWYRSAVAVLERHAAMELGWSAERSQSLCFAGECLEALGKDGEAEERYRRAFAVDSTRREPLLRLATLSCRRGAFAAVAQHASDALAIPRTSGYPEPEANYTWLPHSLLYWSLFWLGRRQEARVHWDAYQALIPEDARAGEHARLFPPLPEVST
jgi:tetratricopeptide (TPR) repeat protein